MEKYQVEKVENGKITAVKKGKTKIKDMEEKLK